ncbi:MAG: MarR family winged helix-turn-helix transcriptional regulator [Rhodoglobus sp.]
MTRFTAGPVESPGFLLWHATLRWQRDIAAALAPLGLTHVQFVLLACTFWATRDGASTNQAGVAAQAGTDPKMTSDVVARLERKGLLARAADPQDARAKLLRVTTDGATLAKRAIDVVEDVDARFFEQEKSSVVLPLLHRLAGL